MNREAIMIEFALRHVAHGGGYSADAADWSINAMADEIIRLRDALATVSGERDALAAVVEVLRQYYQMQANDDQLYDAFCAWRENPFTTTTPPHA